MNSDSKNGWTLLLITITKLNKSTQKQINQDEILENVQVTHRNAKNKIRNQRKNNKTADLKP